jgi:tetratricopeptide (TPR) repeat protein
VRLLTLAVFFTIVCILSLLVYALLAGVFMPPAPRTRAEAVLAEAKAAVGANPGNGKAWANYAEAMYATGDKSGAFAAITQANKQVKDTTILLVNNAELHLLLLDGQNAEVVKRSTKYVQKDIDLRAAVADKNITKGIAVPLDMQDNASTVDLFTLRGTAEGNLKKWKDAATDYGNALKIDPQAADVQILRGWASLYAGDMVAAKADFENALRFLPGDRSATDGLAAIKSGKTPAPAAK